ncbi:retrotransposon protein, putative, ty1-copia subclass [Tanacetum coccineum]
MVQSMMSQTTLPKSFWDYALESVARILNMVPTKKVDKTPYKVWHGQAPNLSYLKVWGCEALVKHDTLTNPDKLEPRALNCIFVGYPKETMGYSFYYPSENKVFVARNVEFFENEVIDHEASGSLEDLKIIQEDTHPFLDTSLDHEKDDQEIDEPQSDINPIRRSTRTRNLTDRLCLYVDAEEHELGDLGQPANYKAALLDLNLTNVALQKKTDMDGAVHTYKARLVAKGFTQTPVIDYEETFSSIADIRAIRILIAITAFYDYEIWQMDVKAAFLNGYLNEEQASRQWNKRFNDEIKKFGFNQNRDEPCVYVKARGSYVTFLILYVDDILIMGNNIPMLQDVKSYLERCFAMKDLGEAAYILGIKIYRDRSKRLIGLCQNAYIEKILKRFYMENSKHGTILMQEKLKLSKSQGASTPAEIRRMQNIPYASNPGDDHWTAVKNILKYLRNTKDMFLVYGDAEYIVAFDASKDVVWIQKFIYGLGVVPTIEEPINMYCDNTRVIAIAKDHGVTKGARHFRAKVHYLRETIEMGDVKIDKVDTYDNLADPFTKALAFPKHSKLTEKIGMIPASNLMFFIDGPYAPRTACSLNKLEAQWNDERRVAWEGTIPNFEGPSEIKENRVMVLKLAYNTFRHLENKTFTRYIVLMNEIVNDGVALSNHEVNIGLVNSLPKKLLSFNQALRNSNQVRDLDLATLFVKFKYEVRLIDIIYEPETKKVMSTSTSASAAIFSNSIVQNFYLRGAAYGN